MHKSLNRQLIKKKFRSRFKTRTSTNGKELCRIKLILSLAQSHRLISQNIRNCSKRHKAHTTLSKSSQIRAKSIRSLHCHSPPFYRMTNKSIVTECSQRHRSPFSTPMMSRMHRCCSLTASRTTRAQMRHLPSWAAV